MKPKKRKRRLKKGRVLLLILILLAISFLCYKFVNIPVRSITIKGNEILTDNEIIEIAKLNNYPSIFNVFSFDVKNKLEKNPYIEKAKITKAFLNIKITVTEKKVLYINYKTKEKVTDSTTIKDDKTLCVPYLTSDILSEKKDDFIKAMGKIDKDILCKMSEIKYDPNDIDKDRYLVHMNDGNSVYLTVNKFKKINKYDSILESVGKQNGTLYLDYGDYFQAK